MPLELRRLRIGVLDHVLGRALGHQLFGLRLHPCSDERGQVEPGVAVQAELVAYRLQCGPRHHAMIRQLVNWNGFEFDISITFIHLLVQGHFYISSLDVAD